MPRSSGSSSAGRQRIDRHRRELVDELSAAVEAIDSPELPGILTMALVEAGRPEEARAILHCIVPGPEDYRWLYTQCWSLLAAVRLGDTEHITWLRDQLLPYRQLTCAVFTVVVSGSVAYFTGEAALALGDPHAALADLTIAVEIDDRMGASPWPARARDGSPEPNGAPTQDDEPAAPAMDNEQISPFRYFRLTVALSDRLA